MYLVINIDQMHHLNNEPKKSNVFYNKDRREYQILLATYLPISLLS